MKERKLKKKMKVIKENGRKKMIFVCMKLMYFIGRY